MTERHKELLSAYLDDALDDVEAAEFAALLREQGVGPDSPLPRVLHGYTAIGEMLRGRAPVSRAAIAERVAKRVRDEPLPQANADTDGGIKVLPFRRRHPRFMRALTSVAMAASVAIVAIGGVRMLNSADSAQAGPSAPAGPALAGVNHLGPVDAIPVSLSAPVSETARYPGALSQPLLAPIRRAANADTARQRYLRFDVRQPNVEARLHRYLIRHSEVTRQGLHGMVPYARIVGYETAAR